MAKSTQQQGGAARKPLQQRLDEATAGSVVEVRPDDLRELIENPIKVPEGVNAFVGGDVLAAMGQCLGSTPRIGSSVLFFDISREKPLIPRSAVVSGIGERGYHLTVLLNPEHDVAARGNSPLITLTNVPWAYNSRPGASDKWCVSVVPDPAPVASALKA